MTPTKTPTTASCPICGEPVAQPWTGRPRAYCSAICRREMYRMVAEVRGLEAEFAETQVLLRAAPNAMMRGVHQRSLEWLRLAIAEARSRIPASPTPPSTRKETTP